MEAQNFISFYFKVQFIFYLFLILLFIFIVFIVKKTTKKKEEVKTTKPKQSFEYLDFFFYKKSDFYHSQNIYAYFVIRELTTNKIYALFNWNVDIKFSKYLKEIRIQRPDNQEVNFYDKGVFWIKKNLDKDFYCRNNKDIKLGYEMLKYAGNIEEVKHIDTAELLYNLNPKYDISLLDEATFIEGYAEFTANK